ncbi:hypothetical protein ABPG72_016791 [Tetrahymena utriculariae]
MSLTDLIKKIIQMIKYEFYGSIQINQKAYSINSRLKILLYKYLSHLYLIKISKENENTINKHQYEIIKQQKLGLMVELTDFYQMRSPSYKTPFKIIKIDE